MDVALATCARLPEPDFDAEPLLEALDAAGLEAGLLAWDDPTADWSRATMTLLRSTWNYPLDPAAFTAWARHAASVSDLWNPIEVVRCPSSNGLLTKGLLFLVRLPSSRTLGTTGS